MILLCQYISLIVYKTQRICDEAVADCLAAIKFTPDWFVTKKILEKLDNSLHANDDILLFNKDFDKVFFITNQRHILILDLDKINLDNDNNFDEDDLDTIIHARLLAWCSKFKKHKVKKLMAVGFYPKRWWNFWKSKDEKKEMEIFFAA